MALASDNVLYIDPEAFICRLLMEELVVCIKESIFIFTSPTVTRRKK